MTRDLLVRTLLASYRLANSAGLLRFPITEWVFLRLYFLYKRFIEDPYANLIRTRPELFSGGHILDVGANVGYTSLLFARVVSSGYRVFAFEPEAENFRRMQRMVARSPFRDRISAYRLAIGSREGTVALLINPAHPGDHRIATPTPGRSSQEVSMTSIDNFVRQADLRGPICFVKVDVQGYEVEVSRGMERMLEENRKIGVGLELSPEALRTSGSTPQELMQFYTKRSFRLETVERRGAHTVSEAEAAAKSSRGYIDLLFTRRDSE